MHLMWVMQVHHLDTDFYDRFFRPGAYGATHPAHLGTWHPQRTGSLLTMGQEPPSRSIRRVDWSDLATVQKIADAHVAAYLAAGRNKNMDHQDPQPIVDRVAPAVLALNNAHAVELSWLDAASLAALIRQAFYARRIGDVGAFLIALDQTAKYESPNYLWFQQRYSRFVYIDRVLVAPSIRGGGYARRLYRDLFDHARWANHQVVVCEVNIDPPNPASDAFHASMEFREVGRAAIHQGSKTVRYLSREI